MGSVFVLAGGFGYELDQALDRTHAFCFMCPTIWHPFFFPFVVGVVAAAVILGLVVSALARPEMARGAGAVIVAASAVSLVAGDQFWVGGVLGLVGGLALIAKRTSTEG